MALLAMEQYGIALASLNRAFIRADSVSAIRRVLRTGKVAVWSPTRAVLGAKDIPCSWDVTGDSLAAWLAGRIGAGRLLLVKHVAPRADVVRASELAASGIVDPAFRHFLPVSGIEAFVSGPGEYAAAGLALDRGTMIGSRIDLR